MDVRTVQLITQEALAEKVARLTIENQKLQQKVTELTEAAQTEEKPAHD